MDLYRTAYGVLVAVAVAAWAVAAISAWRMLEHRDHDRSRLWFAANGMAFFTGKGFGPGAEPHRRLMVKATLAFFATILAAVAITFLSASRS